MEKRLLLAVVLMTAAIVLTNILFGPTPQTPPAEEVAAPAAAVASGPSGPPLPIAVVPLAQAGADSVVVTSELYRFVLDERGGTIKRAELPHYPSYSAPGGPVQLVLAGVDRFFAHRLVVGQDTIDLRSLPFEANLTRLEVTEASDDRSVEFRYLDASGFGVTLQYAFSPTNYGIAVTGQVEGLGGRAAKLLTSIGPGLEAHEHPDHHSEQQFAVVTRAPGSVDRRAFGRLEGTEFFEEPFTWAGIKDKYFAAVLVASDAAPLEGVRIADAPDGSRQISEEEVLALPRADVTTVLPVAADGSFAFQAYLGPQDYDLMNAIGYDLEEVTPYGYRWLQPVIRPLAAAVVWVLNTLHNTLGLAYGWVLVVFGVLMRIVLWPLNAKAMRAQMKNMGVQPLLQDIRERYKNDPQKQQEAMLALYKEHGFNPFAGCLPLLVPFPVLITLFFVFQNTIAFRGASFLWLPDLSLRDPFYILPLILVISMFALQWVSAHLSGIEQNAQMKMMLYLMPLMMGVIFFMLPAGLNLYYAVTQVASVPQQVMIAKERRAASEALKKTSGPKLAPTAVTPKKRKKSV